MSHVWVLAAGYFSIDRIELPESVHDSVPGGAALYAALGARFAGASASIAATVGDDYPVAWTEALQRLGIGTTRVTHGTGITRRAGLKHFQNGARTSAHHRDAAWWERTQALAPRIPAELDGISALALGPMPMDLLDAFVAAAQGRVPIIVADTSAAFAAADTPMLLSILPRLGVFAPSCEETRLLFPGQSDDEAAHALARCGVHVLQKRGSDGALAVMAGAQHAVRIAAWPATVCDPTGAGDATLGALAAHLAFGLPFPAAAQAALKAGSKAVSAVGPSGLGLVVWQKNQESSMLERSRTP